MSKRLVHRPARTQPPDPDPAPLQLLGPPSLPDANGGTQGLVQVLLPVLGGAGSLVMIVVNRSPVMLIAGGLMLVGPVAAAVVLFVAQRTGARRRAADLRRRYLDYLDGVRAELGVEALRQRAVALHHHPPPEALPQVAVNPVRRWERRPQDADFLVLRVGTGAAPLWRRVTAPASRDPLADLDPVTAAALGRIERRERLVGASPVGLPIAGRVSVVGPAAAVRGVVTAALAQLVTLHGPGEVRLMVCALRRSAAWLDWVKWLPHVQGEEVGGSAPPRLVTDTPEALRALLGPELDRRMLEATRAGRYGRHDPARLGPAIVILIDQTAGPAPDPLAGLPPELRPADLGVHTLTLARTAAEEPEQVDVRLVVDAHHITVQDRRPPGGPADPSIGEHRRALGASAGLPDRICLGTLMGVVRALAGVRLAPERDTTPLLEAATDLPALLGVDDVGTFDPRRTWSDHPAAEFLRVPFGVGPAGERVILDLKEPALGGMGPHGLCVGATGSGKSEVLRTLVLGLAVTHPPERLAAVLVDYKGGATFAGLGALPHCAAMITNLSDDAGLVDRLHDALVGELKRRQALLASSGNVPNITEYHRRRDALRGGIGTGNGIGNGIGSGISSGIGNAPAGGRAGHLAAAPDMPEPLPTLLVVIDEFGELLTAKPEFIELFLAIGRVGRSIGMHLLLASQRVEEGRLRGLESFLSYRLGLRTFNAQESRAVLGVPDAYELPPVPGSGYLKVDTTVFQRFKASYVSGTYRSSPSGRPSAVDAAAAPEPFGLFNDPAASPGVPDPTVLDPGGLHAGVVHPGALDPGVLDPGVLDPTVLDVAVRRLAAAGRRTQQIWLPPLPSVIPLDVVSGAVREDPVLGLRAEQGGRLRIRVGLLDRPADQRQEPYAVDLASSGGHLAVLGAPQSGKSTLLRTLLVSAALTHLPSELAFACLDLGGGSLRVLETLPHVAGVASRLDPDRVRRTVAEVAAMLAARERLSRRLGIDTVDDMRERHRAGRLPELPAADVVLVIDDYPVLRTDFDDLTDVVQDLATRGPGYGVHLVLTCGRWADVRLPLQATIGTKIELRLNEPADSAVDRRTAANLRRDNPGRALVDGGLQVQVCLPVLHQGTEPLPDRLPVEKVVAAIAAAWPGDPVPPIRMLPALVPHELLVERARADRPRAARSGDGGGTGQTSGAVLLGVDEAASPVELDLLGGEPHLLVIGDGESGKTSLLRAIVRDLTGRGSDQEVVFAVFDVRRTLLDVVPEAFLGAYAGTAAVAPATSAAVAAELRSRLPPADVTAAVLRARSWWRGPEVIVLVDDYDLLSPGGPGPLAALAEFLPLARDVGFHLVLARRSGGAGRALYEPVPQRMREVGATGLLLSGDRHEGQLFPGVHLAPQPPGRAQLVRRGRPPALIQLGYVPPP